MQRQYQVVYYLDNVFRYKSHFKTSQRPYCVEL